MEFPVGVEFEDFLVLPDDLDFEIVLFETGLTALGMVEDGPGRLDPDANIGFRIGFSEALTLGITLDVKSHERLVKSLLSSSICLSRLLHWKKKFSLFFKRKEHLEVVDMLMGSNLR